MRRYANRRAAGLALAEALAGFAGRGDVLVLGLPRGGVVVAAPVAAALGAPLDVLVVRKLGLPRRPELAMGAVADVAGEVVVVRNDDVLRHWPVPDEEFEAVLRAELVELHRREEAYRAGRPPLPVAGRIAVVVDDGLATGATMRAAVAAVRARGARQVVAAVPVGAGEPLRDLRPAVDEVVCLEVPRPFAAVGEAYTDFAAVSDEEVLRSLSRE